MTNLIETKEGSQCLLMGNEAIARGALEAGVGVAAGYPGTPSSEIIEGLSKVASERGLYVEWSVNEKVAMEVAAAASFAGLRSICTMKQNGLNVASDFLLHLAYTGIRGGMLIIECEDPGLLSSQNEGDARFFARMLEVPLVEPASFQEALELTKWSLELSEGIKTPFILRSVTRMSHASGNVRLGPLPPLPSGAKFEHRGRLFDFLKGPMFTGTLSYMHALQQAKVAKVTERFETAPFNTYEGPSEAELLIVTSSSCYLYAKEAIRILGVESRVGMLKFATTWPLPPNLLRKHLKTTGQVLVVEEVLSFLEDQVKVIAAESAEEIGLKKFYGKRSGHIQSYDEQSPEKVIKALTSILGIEYEAVAPEYALKAKAHVQNSAPGREMTFCPGCPHRASFWSIHNALEMDGRDGFVCGDVGCYTLALLPTGFSTLKTSHSMGSGSGLASGFGKLKQFGMEQKALAVCGDSTFFHAVMPALVNAVHHESDIVLVVLDNGGTAMTGFQPHPGLDRDVLGNEVTKIDIREVCEAIGAKVEIADPFDTEATQKTLLNMMQRGEGAQVLILKQPCALSPEKKRSKLFEMNIDTARCLGERCGCNRLCTRIFRCPGLIWDCEKQVARLDEVMCSGCGVCAQICPTGAISATRINDRA
jgi:indolepyruvate ferredoxin oxidoreductase, alpha subunit